MQKDFERLIQDFCRLCSIADTERVAKGAAVEVDDVAFSIVYDESSAPDRLHLFCDYGEVPKGQEEATYRALLETNLVVYGSDTAVFSLSPETGRVVCATRFALQNFRAEELRGVMTYMSQSAKEWRQNDFGPLKPAGASASRTARFAFNKVVELNGLNKSRLDGAAGGDKSTGK